MDCEENVDCELGVYQRVIRVKYRMLKGESQAIVDLYDIGTAYNLSHPLFHALKKILVAGGRGAKGKQQDLEEAIASIRCAIDTL